MNKYESVVIINPDIKEENIKKTIEKLGNIIKGFNKENNSNLEIEELGEKKLAYEIKKHNIGYYVIFNFECENNYIQELERVYRIMDEVLKFIVIRKDE